ncbi:uncharacterized protein BCR38DRAFT_58470 [Pseudomassariella vexata]|uniref:Mg2+ transporter protein, CorA-like/Zinc transport protein ZntB n=1 Tax=Pseudomassariella vexata TaxID=1141098 RepID=A0A1Y2DJS7_9PEZI|nr:uncharacterized protein BCR38DRAFT_58470 [Pseudomassariella vexata]ORY59502.1 hypothetical protein BCR38DRAFT_58470 [Pseudomassariella vexata]
MDEVVYADLLRDRTLFAPADGHRAFEMYHAVGDEGSQFKERVLSERQISSWLRNGQSPRMETSTPPPWFRLLVCSPRTLDQNIWPIPLASDTLQDVLHLLGVPSLFPRAVCRHVPVATPFDSLDDTGRYGMVLRTNLSWTWQYALAMVHDPKTKSTTGIVIGLRSSEAEEVLLSIRKAARLLECPAMLPCIFMDIALDSLCQDAEGRRKSLLQICYETGLHGFQRASFKGQWDDRNDLDLDVLMQKLTGLSDACAGISAVCQMQANFIDAISSFKDQWDPDNSQHPSRHVQQRLSFFRSVLHGVESKIIYTKSSAQGQVQTIYTLISQRDSRSHFVLAEATQKLAAMSRKDSIDMRIIAAVTLIFLPATFTATFFSASFFNFQPSGGDHVSSWVWLYWVVTVLLTIIVLGSWWYSARLEHVKAQDAFRRESEMQLRRAETEIPKALFVETGQPPSARVEVLRPYLGGSLAEGVFAQRGEFVLPKATCYACLQLIMMHVFSIYP